MNTTLRAPAVPLITHDPYFSIWSFADKLTDTWTRHWTGLGHNLHGLLRVDGKVFRFIGTEPKCPDVPPAKQKSVVVLPTRTIYEFEARGILMTLTFLTPSLPHKLDILSRPLTYVIFDIQSIDSKPHDVAVHFQVAGEISVNSHQDQVSWSRIKLSGMEAMSMFADDQRVLQHSGDDLRIEWGRLYLAAPANHASSVMDDSESLLLSFIEGKPLPASDSLDMPHSAGVSNQRPAMAVEYSFTQVTKNVRAYAMVAYDDVFSLEYMHRKVRPWWRRTGWNAGDLLKAAETDFNSLREECEKYDSLLMNRLRQAGGEKYALVSALAFRQCIAAHKLAADYDGTPIFMSKENFSNGCINTVDVTYPSSPFFLLLNPELLKAQISPILDYAGSSRWKFPFAPHDLGTYPLANGQVYGGAEKTEKDQMPVEECGNMLIMVAALIRVGEPIDYALKYWKTLETWANYLKEKGLDPENQLCTDDFAGHLAHNTNLSVKAIVALGSFASLCEKAGKMDVEREFFALSQKMAKEWELKAGDGDHYRLTFDTSGTWSQKYNLVWDKLLGLDLFSKEVARKELDYYITQQEPYGLPLDSRSKYTKLDWIFWTATLSDSDEMFQKFLNPVFDWVNESPSRAPLTDWYWADKGEVVAYKGGDIGFRARSVVGGILIKLLSHEKMTPLASNLN